MKEFIEKLIGRLEEKQDEYFHGKSDYEEGKYNAYDEVAQIVNQLSEEYKDVPDINVGKWIPVSEALPDDFMSYEYLTIRKGQTLATITYYCVVNHKWYSNRKSTKEIDVIAWQHLPQLCKVE